MSKNKFRYSSVHDYLDEVLGTHPSHAEIKQAKEDYWRHYNSNLKRERRRELKYVSLSLSHAEHKQLIRLCKEQGVSLYDYIREVSLNPKPFRIPNTTINKLEQISLELQDLHEEAREEEAIEDSFWETSAKSYQELQLQIQNLKNKLA